jgi:hypothetical protein
MAMISVQKGGARKAHLGMVIDCGRGEELRTQIGLCGTSVLYVNGGGDILDRAYALDRLKRGESVFYQRWVQMDEAEERKTRASRVVWDAMLDASWDHTNAMEAIRDGERRKASTEEMRLFREAAATASTRLRELEAQEMAKAKEKVAA